LDSARSLKTRDGAVIGYRLWRPGTPRRTLLLLHGLASNQSRWSEFVAGTSLKTDWDILRPDLRGHGTSLDRGRIGMDEWCADLAAVLEAERVERAVVAGHCLGANVAVEFARRNPDAVRGLVLIEPILRDALRGSLSAASRGLADLGAIRVPVLALLSTGGALSDPVLTERRLRALPNCRVVRLAADHWIPTEQPEAMRTAIEAWCTELATAVRP